MRPQLRIFADERGRELLEVPDGALPDPSTTASPRLMPEYDNFFPGHEDRSRISDEADRMRMSRSTIGWQPVLIDGFIRGVRKLTAKRGEAVLRIEPTRNLSRSDAAAVEAEGAPCSPSWLVANARMCRSPSRTDADGTASSATPG